jgi:hypothetical protein
MREAIRFRDAVALLLRLLPMRCPLTVRVAADFRERSVVRTRWLALALIAMGTESAVGGAAGGTQRRALSRGGVSQGGSSTSITSGIGVFRRVFCWCVRGVVWRTHGHVGLLDGVSLAATLGAGVGSTLDGVTPPTLCGSALSTLGDVATSSL